MTYPDGTRPFTRHVLIAVGVASLAVVLLLTARHLSYVLLLVFAAVLFAILLGGIAYPLQRHARMPRLWAVIAASLGVIGLAFVIGRFAGPAVAEQVGQLSEQLPDALMRLEETLSEYSWGEPLLTWTEDAWEDAVPSAPRLLGGVTGVFSTMLGGLTNALLILIIGFYLALDPRLYWNGLLCLFPATRRARFDEVLQTTAHALRWWLIGRAITMTVVGVLTALGLWIIDSQLILVLAVIAGLLSFVPFIGPIISAVPAIMVGLIQSPAHAVYVAIVYAVVQFVESNVITPYVQVRAVALPPALLLGGQVFVGVLFGMLGLLLATPLLIALIVPIQMLYVGDILGERVTPLGK